MRTKSHNKKRDTRLIYEFLVMTISRALVNGDKRESSQALKLLKRHFKPGTELYKEFRLANALLKTTVASEAVAASILKEAKEVARSHSTEELDRQKSLLIKNINHNLGRDDFYDQQVSEYKQMATIQTLLNDWRNPNCDIQKLAIYEDQLVKWLTTEKTPAVETTLSEDSPGSMRLLMKVLTKKLNEKYSGVLNDDQKALIRAYAFSTANDEQTSIKKKLEEMRTKLVGSIDSYVKTGSNNQYVNNKIEEVRNQLLTESFDTVDDDTVTRFMLYTKLCEEIESGEDNG